MEIEDIPAGAKIFFKEDIGMAQKWLGGVMVVIKSPGVLWVRPHDNSFDGAVSHLRYVSHVLFPGKLNPQFVD